MNDITGLTIDLSKRDLKKDLSLSLSDKNRLFYTYPKRKEKEK